MAAWAEEGRGLYDDQYDDPHTVVGWVNGPPVLRKEPVRMTAKEWSAWYRGERRCIRCGWTTDSADVFGCDECGARLYGRAA